MNGYKGVPILAACSNFDLVKGMVCDYMHCVMLGVTKMLMELWFQAKHRQRPFSIRNKVFFWSLPRFHSCKLTSRW